jgi:hypothetical protein
MSQIGTRVYDFTLTMAGVDELTAEVADALYEVGCDDASLHSEGTILYLDFHREAGSLGDAIGSAVKAVEAAGFSVARVEIDAPQG